MRENLARPGTVLIPLLNLSVAPAMLGYLPSQAAVPTPLNAAGAEPLRLETRGGLPGHPIGDHAALQVPVHTLIKVARDLETGIREAARAEAADLLLLHWKGYSQTPGALFGATLDTLVAA